MNFGKALSRALGMGGKYTAPADNSLELERMQQAEREANRVREEERKAAELAQRRSAFSSGLESAITGFRQNANTRFSDMGLNPNDFSSYIENAITSQRGLVPDLAETPGSYFSNDVLDNTLNRITGDRRQQYTTQARNIFTPNKEYSIFGDDADDSYINDILGTQRQSALTGLDYARRRGSLNESGYNAALGRIGEMEQAGRSTANTLGGAVLDRYRGNLREIGNEALTGAGSYTLGTNFDLSGYKSRYDQKADDLRGRLSGDINSAISGQQFFDLGDILTRGGTTQGPTNAPLNLDFMAQNQQRRNAQRGIGGEGTF